MRYTTKLLSTGLAIWTCLTMWGQYAGKGIASYYSDKLHGRRMSNGERYHMDSMTCAHRNYPLGTMLKVRNPLNGKEVVVEVTDRGPFTKKFIIDLSKAAAKKLGVYHAGWTTVEISPYRAGESPYKLEDTVAVIPELDLNYEPIATYPDPGWRKEKNSGKSKQTVQKALNTQKTIAKADSDTIIPPSKPIKKVQAEKTGNTTAANKANKTSNSNNVKIKQNVKRQNSAKKPSTISKTSNTRKTGTSKTSSSPRKTNSTKSSSNTSKSVSSRK